jgi:hypothetical protein
MAGSHYIRHNAIAHLLNYFVVLKAREVACTKHLPAQRMFHIETAATAGEGSASSTELQKVATQSFFCFLLLLPLGSMWLLPLLLLLLLFTSLYRSATA